MNAFKRSTISRVSSTPVSVHRSSTRAPAAAPAAAAPSVTLKTATAPTIPRELVNKVRVMQYPIRSLDHFLAQYAAISVPVLPTTDNKDGKAKLVAAPIKAAQSSVEKQGNKVAGHSTVTSSSLARAATKGAAPARPTVDVEKKTFQAARPLSKAAVSSSTPRTASIKAVPKVVISEPVRQASTTVLKTANTKPAARQQQPTTVFSRLAVPSTTKPVVSAKPSSACYLGLKSAAARARFPQVERTPVKAAAPIKIETKVAAAPVRKAPATINTPSYLRRRPAPASSTRKAVNDPLRSLFSDPLMKAASLLDTTAPVDLSLQSLFERSSIDKADIITKVTAPFDKSLNLSEASFMSALRNTSSLSLANDSFGSGFA